MTKRAVIALAAAAGAAACAPTYSTHGFSPQLGAMQDIEAGADTRGSVLRKLGQPSSVGSFDSDTWYYVATRMEHFAFYQPEVVDRTVVAVTFDDVGLVENVDRYGLEDGKLVSFKTDTTPTYGRELTVLQQLFSNIGNIGAGDIVGN